MKITELKRILYLEKSIYLKNYNWFHILRLRISKEMSYQLWSFVKWLRICEYFKANDGKLNKFVLVFCRRIKNKKGIELSIEIHENCFGEGLAIYHGGIVVNSKSKIGKNCKLHGNNCIGNNGKNDLCPNIGNNVEIGYGAGVYGNITVPDDCTVGANAVLIKTPSKKAAVLVGVPSHEK